MVWYIGFRPTIPSRKGLGKRDTIRDHKSCQAFSKTFRQRLRAQRAPLPGKRWRNIEKLLAGQNEPETKAGDQGDNRFIPAEVGQGGSRPSEQGDPGDQEDQGVWCQG